MKQRTYAIFALLILATTLAAQEKINYDSLPVIDYESPREYVIADIQISGVEFIQKEVLISLSGLKVGSKVTLPGDKVTDLLKKFWAQGLFRMPK
ncbi:MAG: hypothetical protein R2751_17900 [Bacteroidales bacterium]